MTLLLDKQRPKVSQAEANKLTPWFDAECRESCRRARAAERRYRRTQEVDRTKWLCSLKSLRSQYEHKNQLYWRDKIVEWKGDSRSLWRTMSDIMDDKKDVRDAASHFAEEFATFLSDKVDTVRQSTSATLLHRASSTATYALHQWDHVTSDDAEKLIGNK